MKLIALLALLGLPWSSHAQANEKQALQVAQKLADSLSTLRRQAEVESRRVGPTYEDRRYVRVADYAGILARDVERFVANSLERGETASRALKGYRQLDFRSLHRAVNRIGADTMSGYLRRTWERTHGLQEQLERLLTGKA